MLMNPNASLLLGAGLVLSSAAAAAAYPDRPIRFIMPYPAGGSIDVAGRLVAQKTGENLGQQVVVDNRTGAGGTIATGVAARSAPDGYTICMGGTGTLSISPNIQRELPYDPVRDFAPVALLAATPYVLAVTPSFPPRTVKELIAAARAAPGKINYASGGTGSAPHLTAELFESMAGIRMTHVPYKGSTPAITDTMSGQTQLTFTGIPSIMGHIKSGRIRPMAVTSAKRTTALPDVPAIAESVPGYDVSPWFGVLMPKGTPAATVGFLNKELIRAMASPNVRERFATEGVEPIGGTPDQFADYIKTELVKWGKVLKDAGISAE
jgi:tripartite-type tricarboxylate transporter receptor subunit TctC